MAPSKNTTAALTIHLDRTSDISLQEQIRREIIDRIATGLLPTETRLPSSRKLSAELKVSRNTVAAVYERLIADGHLTSRDRSGIYVQGTSLNPERSSAHITGPTSRGEAIKWRARMRTPGEIPSASLSPDWHKYPYPFVDGPFDQSLFPLAEWREASRRGLSVADIEDWTRDLGDADDEMLITELRRKVLPWRGITARPDEILITTGAQQGLHLITELFVTDKTVVGVENPCNRELRLLLESKGAKLHAFDVDPDGMIIDEERLQSCDIVFLTPGRQRPMGVTLSEERRHALLEIAAQHSIVLVEDDYQWEAGFADTAPMAMRGQAGGDNIIYTATLAQPLASAIRLGVLVAPAPVIRAARQVSRMTSRHPALSIQRTFAHMLALGHYATVLRRVEQALAARMLALRDALNHYLPTKISLLPGHLSTAAWITGPPELDAGKLIEMAQESGVLIEQVSDYYIDESPTNAFRLGVTGISETLIREGVAAVAKAFAHTLAPTAQGPTFRPEVALTGSALEEACAGATLLCKTVYGDPCTIRLSPDGLMFGRAGFANEEQDVGKWWIEDDFWCRRWREWAYGETAKFRVIIDGERIQWFSADGRLIDTAVIARAKNTTISTKA